MEPVKNPLRHPRFHRANFDEVVLVNAGINRTIPDGKTADLVFAAVAFDYEKVACAHQELVEFSVCDADVFDVIKAKLVCVNIRHPEIRQLFRQLRAFWIFGQPAIRHAELLKPRPGPPFRQRRELPCPVRRVLCIGHGPASFGGAR